ncbi:zinc finger CCHC domain-containing protein 8 homolog [Ostrinia furnacalis]|uniref:zinc finger CCHC domain-containing protein 8 homolog n=1 Tax=Ostrinia furnacalis TaxID=93504 RepID=UPI00103C61A1|nr:zinc finger CCHC domain-containing protein 8 homolog [Ostrinia furnacalis]
MSKRKAVMKDIIYELDNEDIEISSDDEAKEAKINRLETKTSHKTDKKTKEEENNSVITILDTPEKSLPEKPSHINTNSNGGKISPDDSFVDLVNDSNPDLKETEDQVDSTSKLNAETNKTTILDEDIVVDSPTSTSDLGVVGCENRTPLVTVRFRDQKLASNYKNKIKAFMLRLIKLHDKESSSDIESETDIELDIWPEDLNDDGDSITDLEKPEPENNLFFIDTEACSIPDEIPAYIEASTVISNPVLKEPTPPPTPGRRPVVCFNCDGAHQLRECKLPRNYAKINDKRRNMTTRVGRYHVEDEQKYGHLTPGRISGKLRDALGLKRHELPLYIYQMRYLGYPPGWLEEARISHSGITMFDSTGAAILDPEEEEGEVCEPGCKDKFDIKKILDFPGFNVPFSSRYKEEGHLIGAPPMSEEDSKIRMLQVLAPNAMKAYKRKKLLLFPSAVTGNISQEVSEMDLDSGDETAEFPSVPPLPDEAPPPPPPLPAHPPPPPPQSPEDKSAETDDIEVVSVMKVGEIPVPEVPSITIDDDDENGEPKSGRTSPSLDDLEEKKRRLLSALQGGELTDNEAETDKEVETPQDDEAVAQIAESEEVAGDNPNTTTEIEPNDKEIAIETEDDKTTEKGKDTALEKESKDTTPEQIQSPIAKGKTDIASVSTSDPKTGNVKTTLYGTPVINVASPYLKLPSDDKFAKDICDVINFENLPNSTGKYKQISSILKKVKTQVDRIQES